MTQQNMTVAATGQNSSGGRVPCPQCQHVTHLTHSCCPHTGRDERPLHPGIRCPKLQPAISRRESTPIPPADSQLHQKVGLIW